MPTKSTALLPLAAIVAVAVAFAAGAAIRSHVGTEVSVDEVQTWVRSLGWKGPLLYIGLVTFRQFLLLPSLIVLSAGGLCFGALGGTVLGTTGILLSAMMKFGIARTVGRAWIRRRFAARLARIEHGTASWGPVVVALATAHPFGPMAPVHWAAGASSIALVPFLVAVAIGGPLRAGAYSVFGSTLRQPGSLAFYLAITVLLLAVVLPLLHPAWRRRLHGTRV
jgi:uncharacterized membrane protein YdjX (TVP38/TMEM64 family)